MFRYKKRGSFSTTSRGRDDRIRTCGILVPNQALYQTEPHPVAVSQQRDLLYTIISALSTLFLKKFQIFNAIFLNKLSLNIIQYIQLSDFTLNK